MEIGVDWRLSGRFWAVTVTTVRPLSSANAAAAAASAVTASTADAGTELMATKMRLEAVKAIRLRMLIMIFPLDRPVSPDRPCSATREAMLQLRE
jgi:hypothetical protein